MNLAAILLSGWLTLGWVPNSALELYDKPLPQLISFTNSFVVDMGVEASWGPFFAGGSVRIPVWQVENKLSFWPTQLESGFNAGIEYGPLRFFYKHICYHAVTPYLGLIQWSGNQVVPLFDGAYDEVGLTIRFGRRSD